ncbi:DUF262 domain-containing protein [Polycyclovorans algicola]|uniref:DUF262 domain-containing protein n=1 Tax=Polycyclovorans algicola TaxID=616992 RepID=UPI0004A78482|nr:DUF262 domain-containing protein [Polycyclovorans algicola]
MVFVEEVAKARKKIVSDGYEMSVGELMNLYRDEEIRINPEFQRLFRWKATRKTRFIESILLGLPLPPIFVYQNEDGVWELIDGLQRLSTILEFVGLLKDHNGDVVLADPLEGTQLIPSLLDKRWEESAPDAGDGIGTATQVQIKRARMRVEILKQESDPHAKFELFQRLNTGGANLSEQEVRNCVGLMLNSSFQRWLSSLANFGPFVSVINQTENAIEKQVHVELALRFFAFRKVEYQRGLDVNEYLDKAIFDLTTDDSFNLNEEQSIFERTFTILNDSLGSDSFRRWNNATQSFTGKFLMSLFEVVAIGVSKNLEALEDMTQTERLDFLRDRCVALWGNDTFTTNSGAGVRGTTRLSNLLALGQPTFSP